MITAPIRVTNGPAEAALNVDGLGEYTGVRVELLDARFRPVPGYSGDDALVVRESGLRMPLT